MAGYVLNEAATGRCAHGGDAAPLLGNPRVKIAGTPVLTLSSQLTISQCSNTLPNGSPFPCVLAIFSAGASRVKVMGLPVLLTDSTAMNVPTGVSTTIREPQMRVKGA